MIRPTEDREDPHFPCQRICRCHHCGWDRRFREACRAEWVEEPRRLSWPALFRAKDREGPEDGKHVSRTSQVTQKCNVAQCMAGGLESAGHLRHCLLVFQRTTTCRRAQPRRPTEYRMRRRLGQQAPMGIRNEAIWPLSYAACGEKAASRGCGVVAAARNSSWVLASDGQSRRTVSTVLISCSNLSCSRRRWQRQKLDRVLLAWVRREGKGISGDMAEV